MAAAVFLMSIPPGSTSGVGRVSSSSGFPGWLSTTVSPFGTVWPPGSIDRRPVREPAGPYRNRCRGTDVDAPRVADRRVVSPTSCKNYLVDITEGVAISGFALSKNRYLHGVNHSACVAPILPLMRARAITGFSPKEFPVRPRRTKEH